MADTSATEAPTVKPLAEGPRRYALTLLLVIYIFNFLDRQIVNILAEPIKIDLGLADWQLGLLTGLAFALFYTFLGLPIARLAERADRAKIVSVAVGVWSLFTVLCGFAGNFLQLLLARIGVGVGEAGCTPPAHSLISDITPAEKRSSAIAFYSMGIPLGSLAGMALGGLIADSFGWRVAFFVAGAPGVILAILAWFTLPEPRRTMPAVAKADGPNLSGAIKELSTKSSFWWISIGAAINAMVGYGLLAFYGSFYLRNHAEGLQDLATSLGLGMGPIGFVGLALGLIIGIFGAVGTMAGGSITDRFLKTDVRGYAFIPAVANLLSIIPLLIAMLTGNTLISLIALGFVTFFGSIWYGPVFASAQGLVKPRTRATASAVLLFVINLIGLGIGPLAAGIISDVFAATYGPGDGLRFSLITIAAVGLLAVPAFLLAARTLREQIEG